MRARGFTLIELLVVMAILALLLTIAVPRYLAHVDRSREAVLRHNLTLMRDAIDKHHADKGRYPDGLGELVTQRYLRAIPADPVTGREDTWLVLPPPPGSDPGAVYEVRSGAEGNGADGTPYGNW
jgi:general secretion pathway protein G